MILDLTVPGGMGGKDTLARLLEQDPAVRAVVSSGYAHGPELANHRARGFLAAITKPYSLRELARIVADVVEDSVQ